ncbi:MAG: DEAD/DEAH box helicase, partial [bacterium]
LKPMQRLLNGDVGSGKTAVAVLAAFDVALSSQQSAVLAPTEILARQHFETFKNLFAGAPEIQIGLLTREARMVASGGQGESVPKKEFEAMLRENMINIVIGTTALLEDWVSIPKLALTIVDEQHRFGVEQREALKKKRAGKEEPHFLSMTATPIPRSLALVAYGDADISILDELPPGRVPVKTKVVDRKAMFLRLGELLAQGERGYVVCPLIDPSDALGVKSVEEVSKELRNRFSKIPIATLHGRMKAEEKDEVMRALKTGEVRIVVSTTVVEVGVDVPEATFIFIEGAERFGLAELHQLRGRVGRGAKPGVCYLSPSTPGEGGSRLAILERENDGFRISEYDLRFRGPGQLFGTAQSGYIPLFRVASLNDVALLEKGKEAAQKTLAAGELTGALLLEIQAVFSEQNV